MPTGKSTFTIVSIDPGSTFLGVGIIKVDAASMEIESSTAFTLNGAKLSSEDDWIMETHGDRVARILSLEIELLRIFRSVRPNFICSESPFINTKFPASGLALTEVMWGIRSAVMKYDQWVILETLPPSNVKQAIGCKGNAVKDDMLAKIVSMKNKFKYIGKMPIEKLDEHSVDALAVGYYKYTQLKLGVPTR